MKILVTPRSVTQSNGHPSLEALRDAGYEVVLCEPGTLPAENQLLKLVPGCVGYLAGVEKISSKVLDAARELRVISRNGTGVDAIDLEAAKRNGIVVCRAMGANTRGVAELTFGLILGLVRSIPSSDAALKSRRWERRLGTELEGRTLGLIGCGGVGKSVARIALGFDMTVLAGDPCADPGFRPGTKFSYVSLEQLLERSDVVSLHCPASTDGKAVIDAATIARMVDGVYVVNTARGSLIDQDDALAGLNSGKIAAIAVDVFEPEPPDDWRLAHHPRVIATPHVGGYSVESIDRAITVAVDNLLNALQSSRNAAETGKRDEQRHPATYP